MIVMKEHVLWKFIIDKLTNGERVMLIVVVAYEKGSPGKTGFKIAFTADKNSIGTIGGGIMEFSLMEHYCAQLRSGKKIRDLRLLIHSTEAKRGEPSGLTCAGSQTICALSLEEDDAPTVRSISTTLQEHQHARMVLSEQGIDCVAGNNSSRYTFQQTHSSQWKYEENIGPEYTVYVIGGGHVGNALSRILATLDVNVVVYDEREDLQLFSENTFAHKKIKAPYSELASHISDPQNSLAAIVTSNRITDAVALKQVLPLSMRYVGMMGTKAKIARIILSLSEEEKKEYQNQNIHAPIGVEIESRTAEEIAVSIAAEIIAVKNTL